MAIRVLTVEDDERIRASVKLALEDEGWIVDEAPTGEDAIAIFQSTPADVVLIDIMLPGIDGFELCRTLRKLSDVPIVMVTARVDTHDVVAGLEAGADDYLTKPFAPKELSARIRALLRRVRPSAPRRSPALPRRPLTARGSMRLAHRCNETAHLRRARYRSPPAPKPSMQSRHPAASAATTLQAACQPAYALPDRCR